MRFWANLLGYQAVWFIVVWAAGSGRPGIGVAAALVFVLLQAWASAQRASDARLVVCALGLGVLIDGALATGGLLRYASPTPALLAPAWILTMWAAFAMTLNHSLAFLQQRIAWAVVVGAIGGPLAYVGAARGFHAVAFVAPSWQATSVLALGWALALPLLVRCAARWRRERPANPIVVESRS